MTEKLKVGILDLLTILLPGGFLLAIVPRVEGLPKSFHDLFSLNKLDEWPMIVFYIGVSYVLGHFIFFLASYLDGWLFENVRKVFWNDNKLTTFVVKLKSEMTGIDDRRIVNAFKWSCAWLLMNQPLMYSEVERHIAESKFFRSLVVVSFICFLLLFRVEKGFAFALLVLFFLSIIRYLTQRQKSIDTAYIYMITASEKKFNNKPDPEKLFELTRGNIGINTKSSLSKYELRRFWITAYNLKSKAIKIFKVLKLCLYPFYVHDIRPDGKPQYKTREIRWFFKDADKIIESWFHKNMPGNKEPEKRTDIYYVNKSKEDIGIKWRNGTRYEIKQKIADDEDIRLTQLITKQLESWGKWSVHEKDEVMFRKMLALKKYHQYSIDKERWAVKLSSDKEGILTINDVQTEMDSGCQLEYTRLSINGEISYSFAAEWFGADLTPVERVKDLSIVENPEMMKKETASYSKFLSTLLNKENKDHHR